MPESRSSNEVFIVDDDMLVRERLCSLFTQAGYRVASFDDGTSFAAAARERTPACIILDIHMPGRSGLDILRDIDARNYPAPIFIASGRGDIPTCVEAIKNGAFDFFEKRTDASTLVERVCDAVVSWERRRHSSNGNGILPKSFPGSELLTPREREVLAQIAASATNKEAARNLGISMRTVEIHRAHVMQKLRAKNSVDLTRRILAKTQHS
jgi:two-component system, LuxR family, response regulator FixJ